MWPQNRIAFSFIGLLAILAQQREVSPSFTSEGTEFFTAFPATINWSPHYPCQLVVVSRFETSVHVEGTYTVGNQTFTVNPYTRLVINFHGDSRISKEGISRKGIRVTSDKAIALFAFDDYYGLTRGRLIIPQSASDNLVYLNVMPLSYYYGSPYSYYAVIAREGNTKVDVYRKTPSGYIFETGNILQNYEYTLLNNSERNEDLTGWKIMSSSSISVLSGNANLMFSHYGVYHDQQIIGSVEIPANHLGTTHLAPGIAGGFDPCKCATRVVATANQTAVVRDDQPYVLIDEGEHLVFNRTALNSPTSIVCTKPCAVTMFCAQTYELSGRLTTGTFQLPIVPEHSFSNDLLFTSAALNEEMSHFLSVVVQGGETEVGELYLDGSSLGDLLWRPAVAGNYTYMHASLPVESGVHSLASANGSVFFTAYLYAHQGDSFGQSYGYPVGFNVVNPVATTTTSTTTPTTTPAADTTSQGVTATTSLP